MILLLSAYEAAAGGAGAGWQDGGRQQEIRVLEKRCRVANGEVLLLQKRLEVEVGTGHLLVS